VASGDRKVWKDIWSAGQGVGNIDKVMPVADIVNELEQEYRAAVRRLSRTFQEEDVMEG